MLNISVAKDAFEKYVSKYDMTDPKVKLKYHHTYRVCEQSLNISKSLGLNEEETNLAYVIALLHDIGRFRQEEVYHTFNDLKSIDHALLGCTILFDEGLIKEFVSDEKYYPVIKDAVFNHNKYSIDCEDEHTLQCKIIRDADKIDIMYAAIVIGDIALKEDDSDISDEVKNAFLNGVSINHSMKKTVNDSIITRLAFVYDLNFKYSYEYFRDNRFIDLFYEKLKNKEKFKEYIDIINSYVERKCTYARGKVFTQ